MSRIAQPLTNSRFGGWALVESPQRQLADGGQQWSLIIVAAAALVAMAAVVFDIRISPGRDTAIVLPSAATISSTDAASVTQRPVAPPSSGTTDAVVAARDSGASTTVDSAAPSGRESVSPVQTPTTAAPPAAATGSNAAESTVAAALASEEAAAATAETEVAASAATDDPASRIREYLGLHAGAQLPVSFSYEVQAGDTATSIAERFGLEEATVLFNNWDIYNPHLLTPGQVLQLPPVNGLVYTVQPGDTLDALMDRYLADRDATLSYPANEITSPQQIFVGQRLLLVHGSASVATPVTSTASPSQATATWTEPDFVLYLRYDKISDYFGTSRANSVGYHTGVDYVAPVGELVGAAAAGVVSVATWDPSYGNWVEIDHGGGYRSRYAHLDIINVREGQWIEAGNYVGTVGNTGNSSGAHLHFEIIVNGEAVNPLAWLN